MKVSKGGRRRFPSSKVRAVAVLCWSSREEIPHTQGKRNPSKMVGVAGPEGTTPHPRPGVAAGRSNPTSKEWWLPGRRRT